MSTQVSFHLPTDLMQEAESAATAMHRGFEEVMVRSVQAGLHSLTMTSELEDFAAMSDQEVLALADSRMPVEQSNRMSELLDRQGEGIIDRLQRAELASLLQFYETGQLLKAGGLAEAARRGCARVCHERRLSSGRSGLGWLLLRKTQPFDRKTQVHGPLLSDRAGRVQFMGEH